MPWGGLKSFSWSKNQVRVRVRARVNVRLIILVCQFQTRLVSGFHSTKRLYRGEGA